VIPLNRPVEDIIFCNAGRTTASVSGISRSA